ncbi:hypothetical protein MYX75_11905, partial [Acidobacteria bacterium AH-259-A15]|nr:hypothetical protein [Acidobacteria bacterium AH-259-A15]
SVARSELLKNNANEIGNLSPRIPPIRYDSVNHQFQLGMLGIGLSPVGNSDPFRFSVWAGLHPNAHVSHHTLPHVQLFESTFVGNVDQERFSWIDVEEDVKCSTEDIVETACNYFSELVVKYYIDRQR